MHTLGYDFRPWREAKAIADGPSILRYVRDTAREHDIESRIRYRQQVQTADWDSDAQCWTLGVRDGDGTADDLSCPVPADVRRLLPL
jgi:monooxygenase